MAIKVYMFPQTERILRNVAGGQRELRVKKSS